MDTSKTTPLARLATYHDIPALRYLELNCFTSDRLSPAQFRHFIDSSTAAVAVCEINLQVVAGAVILFRKRANIARLYSIAVKPDEQGKGIAIVLNDFIEKQVRDRQCKQIRLEVRHDNHRAIDFYNRQGYVIAGEYKQFFEDNADAIKMIKCLKN